MTLLQAKFISFTLELYILSNTTIPQDAILNTTILIYINQSSNVFEELNETTVLLERISSINDNNYEITYYHTYDYELNYLMNKYPQDSLKIVVTNIEIVGEEINYNELYDVKLNLGDYADTSNQLNIDFFEIAYSSYYDINVYKVQEVSLCSQEYKFNLTLDKNIEEDEGKINITFHGNNNKKSFIINSECIFYNKYNNIMLCEAEGETPNFNYTMNAYLNVSETKMLLIYTDYFFPLYCNENPPIIATIVLSSIFFFVIIVVMFFVFFLNIKGRGEKGYNSPNNNNNNIIGLSSGVISK